MGEASKSSGELGENYVQSFLEEIGWSNSISNNTIKCNESKKHNRSNNENGRQTHGIDELFSYESPMDIGTLVHTVISSKHTDKTYPASPSSQFKDHMTDLSDTIECFDGSTLIDECREGFSFNNEQIIGILFWLSSRSSRDSSVISKLNPIMPDGLIYDRIHVIDNERIEFLTHSIRLIKNKFQDYQFSFYYIDTPNNLDDRNKQYSGEFLPIEMLNSDIQLFRLQKENEVILAIVLKDGICQDSLKRIFGLAHRISSNWSSRVDIFAPAFEHGRQENINLVNRIKGQFKGEDFTKRTFVYGYDIGFKDLKKNPFTTKTGNQEPAKYNEPKVDDGKTLPYGEYLRSLLSHSLISDNELKSLLRKKGVYICSPTKEHTIPVLSSLLLSPREFDELKEHQKTKEDKEKKVSSFIKAKELPKSLNLHKVLTNINLEEVAKSKFSNYKFKTPKVNFHTVNNNNNNISLEYEIERYERNKSWDEQLNHFKGTVVFDYNGNELEITSQSTYTSKETQEINKKIISHCVKKLKEKTIVENETKEEKVLMSNMTNEETLDFLLTFTSQSLLKKLSFVRIVSLNLEIDEKISLPDENKLKWMENKINKLKFDGNQIEDTELITDKKNHKFLKCWDIVAEYTMGENEPYIQATVKLAFNPTHNDEFEISMKTQVDRKLYNKKEVEKNIFQELEAIKHLKYKKILEKK